jgi:hypothetical protein
MVIGALGAAGAGWLNSGLRKLARGEEVEYAVVPG